MKRQTIFNVPFRRKRQGKTNYKKRLKLLLANKPRLVIRKSLNYITAQIIEAHKEGDRVMVSAYSKELEKLGWNYNKKNISAAYLTGLLIGKKAKEKNIKQAILDTGFYPSIKGSKIFSCLKGAMDSGLEVPFSEKIIPSEERIKGKHVKKYAELLKENKEKYNKQFSDYIKKTIDPEKISIIFEDIKNKILG